MFLSVAMVGQVEVQNVQVEADVEEERERMNNGDGQNMANGAIEPAARDGISDAFQQAWLNAPIGRILYAAVSNASEYSLPTYASVDALVEEFTKTYKRAINEPTLIERLEQDETYRKLMEVRVALDGILRPIINIRMNDGINNRDPRRAFTAAETEMYKAKLRDLVERGFLTTEQLVEGVMALAVPIGVIGSMDDAYQAAHRIVIASQSAWRLRMYQLSDVLDKAMKLRRPTDEDEYIKGFMFHLAARGDFPDKTHKQLQRDVPFMRLFWGAPRLNLVRELCASHLEDKQGVDGYRCTPTRLLKFILEQLDKVVVRDNPGHADSVQRLGDRSFWSSMD